MKKRMDWQVYVAAAIVVCYLAGRRFYLDFDFINFAAWAFFLSIVAAAFVPPPADEKRGMTRIGRAIALWIFPMFIAFVYDKWFMTPSPFDSTGAIGTAYMKLWLSVTTFGLGFWGGGSTSPYRRDWPVSVRYTGCAVLTAFSIGGYFAWDENRDDAIFWVLPIAFALAAVMAPMRRPPADYLNDFLNKRKGVV